MTNSFLLLICVCMLSSTSLFVGCEASSAFQLPSKCNSKDSLLLTNQSSIYLKNYESKWTSNETTSQSPCVISITSSPSNSNGTNDATFLIRFDLIKPICNQTTSKLTMQLNSANLFNMIDDVCGRFSNENYFIFKTSSNSFELTFTDTNDAKAPDYYLFQAISSITITQFKNSTETTCNTDADEFQCTQPSNICLNQALKCDAIVSCPDGSDELDCGGKLVDQEASNITSTMESMTTLTTTQPTTLESNSTTVNNSSTTNAYVITNSLKPASERRYDVIIGLLGMLLFMTLILVGIWLYGRRKRQWRDFLARLDNNTDWEYEQLEDGPAINASVSRTNVIFNINDDAFDPNMAPSYNSLSTASNNFNSSRASTGNKPNERTPVRP